MIKGIFFDLGGTLWQPFGNLELTDAVRKATDEMFRQVLSGTNPGKVQSLSRAVYEMITRRRPVELRERNCRREIFKCFDSAGLLLDHDMAESAYHVFVYNLARLYDVYHEVPQVLDTLRHDKKLVSGIVSNTIFPGKIMKKCLAQSGLGSLLDFSIFSSDVGWRKPHPNIYLAALSVTSLKPGEILFVGDRLIEDVEGPEAMGMKGIWLCRGDLVNEVQKSRITNLEELLYYIK